MMIWTKLRLTAEKLGRHLRKHGQLYTSTGLVVVCAGSFLPQTVGLSMYQHIHTGFNPQPLSQKNKDLLEQVLFDINLRPQEEVLLEFLVAGSKTKHAKLDVVHAGSLHCRTGGLITLPETFTFDSVQQVKENVYQIQDFVKAKSYSATNAIFSSDTLLAYLKIDWNSKVGSELADSLVLSDDAKKFLIAREVYYVKSANVYINLMMQCTSAIMTYAAGHFCYFYFRWDLILKQWARRGALGLIGCTGLLGYVSLYDWYRRRLDRRVDEDAAKLGQHYALGGVDFYTKQIQRNKAVREVLVDESGALLYTAKGNPKPGLRNSSELLTKRLEAMKKYAS